MDTVTPRRDINNEPSQLENYNLFVFFLNVGHHHCLLISTVGHGSSLYRLSRCYNWMPGGKLPSSSLLLPLLLLLLLLFLFFNSFVASHVAGHRSTQQQPCGGRIARCRPERSIGRPPGRPAPPGAAADAEAPPTPTLTPARSITITSTRRTATAAHTKDRETACRRSWHGSNNNTTPPSPIAIQHVLTCTRRVWARSPQLLIQLFRTLIP